MNILIVSQYFWPENFRINDLVEELTCRGNNVTVITGKPNYPDGSLNRDFLLNPDLFSSYRGAEIIRVPMILRGTSKATLLLNYVSFAISASTIGIYKLQKKEFDIIFAYEPSPITVGLPAIVFRKLKKAPLIFWVLDLWPDTLQAMGIVRSNFLLMVIGKVVTFIYNNCDLILGQSKSFVKHIKKRSNNVRVEYFPSWAESIFYKEREIGVVEKNSKISFNIVFSGNIGSVQDFPSILNAVNLLKDFNDIHWTIIGNGSLFKWLEFEISKRKLTSNITLLGKKPIEDMPKLLQQASVLLLSLEDRPIFSMTIPAKLQVYLLAKKPIVAMINGESANIINKSNSGIACKSGDSQCLADAVKKLYLMTAYERLKIGDNAYIVSKTCFDRNTLIDQLENWMKALITKKV